MCVAGGARSGKRGGGKGGEGIFNPAVPCAVCLCCALCARCVQVSRLDAMTRGHPHALRLLPTLGGVECLDVLLDMLQARVR